MLENFHCTFDFVSLLRIAHDSRVSYRTVSSAIFVCSMLVYNLMYIV